MEITEVRIKLMEDSDDRLRAFCSITFDNCFVVRDLKIIDGTNGPFVAMPSRKLTGHCHKCRSKNHLRAAYCNQCGSKQRDDRNQRSSDGRTKLYADIAHPINSDCREMLQSRVIEEYQEELELSKQPGYVSKYDDDYGELVDVDEIIRQEQPQAQPQPADPAPAAEQSTEPSETPKRRVDFEPHHVEPAAQEPRPPHKAPAKPTAPQIENRPDDEFGAGLF